MKKLFCTLILLLSLPFSSQALTLEEQVQLAAIADGASTYAVLYHPDPGYYGKETNPLAPVNLSGIVLLTAVKASLPYMVRGLEKQDRILVLKFARSAYAGAAANNLVSWKSHDNKKAIAVGLVVAVALWYFGGEELQVEAKSPAQNATWVPTRVGLSPEAMQEFR